MAFLNFNYGLLIYEDLNNSRNPDIRLPDISRNIEGVTVDFDKSERLVVYSNEIKSIATTERPAQWDATTELSFTRPVAGVDTFRITHTGTGTAPAFRSNRSIGGDATSTVDITRVTDYVARIQNTGGTAWSLVGVQVNDFIRFEKNSDTFASPFTDNNQGREYLIQNIGADFIDFVDNGTQASESALVLGADFDKALKALSQGPVKKTDIIQLSGGGVNPSNQGKFEIFDVTDDYVEFVNPLGVTEVVTYGTNSIVIYEYLIGFVNIRASGPIKVRFGSQSAWVQLDRLGSEAIFVSSVCTHKIEAFNDRPDPVTISVQHAMVTG